MKSVNVELDKPGEAKPIKEIPANTADVKSAVHGIIRVLTQFFCLKADVTTKCVKNKKL